MGVWCDLCTTRLIMRTRSSLLLVASVFGGAALAACSATGGPSAPPTLSPGQNATVQSVQPTVQAAATQAAPTIQAAATSAAPTIQAAATQVAAPMSATISASAPIHITAVQSSQSDSTIALQNTSPSVVDMSGWKLEVGSANVALPSGMSVSPGATVTLHTGTGTSTPTDVYLGSSAETISSNLKPGAQVVLQSPSGPMTAFTVPNA